MLNKDIISNKENLIFFKLLLKVIKSINDFDKINYLNSLKKNLSSIFDENMLNNKFTYFDIRIWIDAKLLNKRYIEIMKEKYYCISGE